MLKNLVFLFDGRAKEMMNILENTTVHLLNQKYWFASVQDNQIAALISTLKLSLEHQIIPHPTSSFLIELYERVTPGPFSAFNRANYFVKVYLNDEPVIIPNVECNPLFECRWDSVADLFE